jgi:hypothetical protein
MQITKSTTTTTLAAARAPTLSAEGGTAKTLSLEARKLRSAWRE